MRKVFKKLLIGVMMLVASLPIYADEGSILVLNFNNGSKKAINLEENPVITFTDEEVQLKTNASDASFAFDEISNFSFFAFNPDDADAISISYMLSAIVEKGKDAKGDKADLNGDGMVNIADVLLLINKMKK